MSKGKPTKEEETMEKGTKVKRIRGIYSVANIFMGLLQTE